MTTVRAGRSTALQLSPVVESAKNSAMSKLATCHQRDVSSLPFAVPVVSFGGCAADAVGRPARDSNDTAAEARIRRGENTYMSVPFHVLHHLDNPEPSTLTGHNGVAGEMRNPDSIFSRARRPKATVERTTGRS